MWKQLKVLPNYVVIEITGGCCERFINLCRFNEICMWDICRNEDSVTSKIRKKDFLKIKQYVHKAKVHVRVIEKKGIGFMAFQYRKHYSFLVGIFISLVILKVLSLYVWNISFEGNIEHTDQMLLRFLNENQYEMGMRICDVDCNAIEKAVRNNYEDITWVSAQISGTRLIVHIKENDGFLSVTNKNEDVQDRITASCEGQVVSMITRRGTPLVQVGDMVTPGQELVTGMVSIKNDADEIVAEEMVGADADIVIRTSIAYSDTVDRNQKQKIYSGRTYSKKLFGIPNRYLKFGFVFSEFQEYDIVTEVNNIRLVDDFYTPLWYGKCTYYEYQYETVERSDSELEAILKNRLIVYLNKLEEKNMQIVSNRVNIRFEINSCMMEGVIEADVLEGSGKK